MYMYIHVYASILVAVVCYMYIIQGIHSPGCGPYLSHGHAISVHNRDYLQLGLYEVCTTDIILYRALYRLSVYNSISYQSMCLCPALTVDCHAPRTHRYLPWHRPSRY